MKKEGRQNGTSRTDKTLRLEYNPSRPNNYINRKLDSPPPSPAQTSKSRPNNHSRSKGKCGTPRCIGCQIQRSSKSEENTRGYYKKKSGGVLDRANQKLVTWQAVHNRPGLKLGGGFSATDVLDLLATQEYYDGDDCNAYDSYNANDDDDYDDEDTNPTFGSHTTTPGIEILGRVNGKKEEENDDGMSFWDVGFVVEDEIEGGEDWCLVDEL